MGAPGFARHAIEHHEHGGVGRSRRQFRTDESVPAQRCLEELVVKILIHEVAGGKRDDPQEFPHILLANAPKVEAYVCKGHHVGEAAGADTRHRFEPERLQHIGKTLHECPKVLIAFRVVGTGAAHSVLLHDNMLVIGTQTDRWQWIRCRLKTMRR